MMKLQEYYNKLEEHRYDDDIREKLLKEYEGEPEYNTQEGYLYYKHSKYKVFFNLDDIYEYLSENKNIDLSYIYYDDYDSYIRKNYTREDLMVEMKDYYDDYNFYYEKFEENINECIYNLYDKYEQDIDWYVTLESRDDYIIYLENLLEDLECRGDLYDTYFQYYTDEDLEEKIKEIQEHYNKISIAVAEDDKEEFERLFKEFAGRPELGISEYDKSGNDKSGIYYGAPTHYKVFFDDDDIYNCVSENKNIDLSYIYYDDYDSYVKDHYTDEDFKYKIRDFDFDHDLYRDEFEEYKKSEILNLYGKYKEEIDLYFTDFYYYKKHLEKILNEEKKGAL